MSALFGKRNYAKTVETYVRRGDFDTALEVAIKAGDELYDKEEKGDALDLYFTLLNLYKESNVKTHKLYEKLYEKIISLLFEEGREEEAISFSLLLVDKKLALSKDGEAKSILDTLLSEYKGNEAIILKNVEFNISKGDLDKALSVLNNAISNLGAKPKFIEFAGEILFKLHRYNEAYDYFNALLAVDSDSTIAKERISEIQAVIESNGSATHSKTNGTADKPIRKKTDLKGPLVEPNINKILNRSDEIKSKEPDKNEKILLKTAESEETLQAPLIKRKTVKVNKENPLLKLRAIEPSKIGAAANIPSEKKSKENNFSFLNDPSYVEAINKFVDNAEEGYKALSSVAQRYEAQNFADAEYLYNKLLLIKPDSNELHKKLLDFYKKNGRKEDEIFILRIIANSCSGKTKTSALKKLEHIINNKINIRKEIFDASVEVEDKSDALEYFNKLKDNPNLFEDMAMRMFPLLKNDAKNLEIIAREFKKQSIKSNVSFQYFYTLGKIFFDMGSKPEGLKWLMIAHSITMLPMEDYVKIAEYVKDLPLDSEKDAVAKVLNGYLGVVPADKKEYIYNLILELKPGNSLYIKEYMVFLEEQNRLKEMAKYSKVLIDKMNINLATFIDEKINIVAEYLSEEELFKASELLEIAGRIEGVSKIYNILLKRDPNNKKVKVKLLYLHTEMEDTKFITDFFKDNSPSHLYSDIIFPIANKLEANRTNSPLDYHLHFVLGFLYFLTERYEEAIASFQFVSRSHHFEPLMHLFIGTSFERIGLPDFSLKQYEMIVKSAQATDEMKENAYYKIAFLKNRSGNTEEAREYAQKALEISPKDNSAKKLLENIPEDGKIINIEGKQKK